MLHIPGDGILLADLRHLVRRAQVTPQSGLLLTGDGRPRHLHVTTEERTDPRTAEEVRGGAIWPSASLTELLHTAQAALESRIPGLEPVGRWDGLLLRGARTRLGRKVTIAGKCAVGDESLVERDVMLCHGASIGRRCVIGRGARIERSVILDGGLVAPGEILNDVVRGPRGDISV